MEDSRIVALYWARSQEAISASEEKYGGYCFTVAHNILGSREDSEECVNDTWLKAWEAMPPHRPERLKYFLAKLTRALSFNCYRARVARKRGGGETAVVLEELSECISAETDVEGEVLAHALGDCVREFISGLPRRERDLFLRRYFYTEPVALIAQRYGLTENNTMVILCRTRKKLKAHLRKEGFLDEP